MRFIIALLLSLAVTVSYSQKPLLIVFSGESNSGGYAANSDATSAELAVRTLKILNNNTLTLQPMQIGVNNLLGHVNAETWVATRHSWELGLANQNDSGRFVGRTVYLCKTGQGGTRIEHWAVGATYGGIYPWDTLQKRVDASISLIQTATGQTPEIIFWYSQGINDAIAGTNTTTWRTATEAHFNKIRVKYGNVPIILTYIPTAYNTYNTQIDQVAADLAKIYPITTSDLPLQPDGNHWTYAGQKGIAYRMVDQTLLVASPIVSQPIMIKGRKAVFASSTPVLPVLNERLYSSHLMNAFTDFSDSLDYWFEQYKADGYNHAWLFGDYYYPGSTSGKVLMSAQKYGIPIMMGAQGQNAVSNNFAQMMIETINSPAIYKYNGKPVYHAYDYQGNLDSIMHALQNAGSNIQRNDFYFWVNRSSYPYYLNGQWYDNFTSPPQDSASITRLLTIRPEIDGLWNFSVDNGASASSANNLAFIKLTNSLLAEGTKKKAKIAVAGINHNYASADYVNSGFQTLSILQTILAKPLAQWPFGICDNTADDYVERSYMSMPMNPPDTNGFAYVPGKRVDFTLGASVPYPLMDNSGLRKFMRPWIDKFKASDTTPVTFSQDRIFSWYLLHPIQATFVTTLPTTLRNRWGTTINGMNVDDYWATTFYYNGDEKTNNLRTYMDTSYEHIRIACHLSAPAVLRITIAGVNYDSPTRSGPDAYWEIPLGSKRGTPSFSIVRSGSVVKSGTGRQAITNFCWPGGWVPLIQEVKYNLIFLFFGLTGLFKRKSKKENEHNNKSKLKKYYF